MAGIDAPYRDPREELSRALQRAMRPPPAAPLPTTAPIPVGEVTEVQQPRLRPTPTAAPGGSPEFQAAQRNIGALPAAAPAQPAPAGRLARGASAAGGIARGALPAVAGAVIGGLQARSDAQPQPADTRITARTGPGQIPFDPSQAGPAAVAPRRPLGVGPDNEVTRNIANALNAAPGGGAALGIGRISQGLSTATNTAQQLVRGAQAAAAVPAAAAATDTQAASNRRNGGDLPAPPQGIGDFNDRRFDAAQGITPPETGVVRFNPATNTYSGTDVKEGATITGGRPSGRGTGRGRVSTLDTSEGYASDIATLGRLREERAEREAGFAANQPGAGLSGIADPRVNAQPSTDDRVRELMRAGLSNRQALQAVNQERGNATQAENAQRSAAVQARGQDIGAAQATQQQRQQAGIARMQDATQRDIAVLNASRPTAAANQQPRFTAVNLPDTVDANGQVVRGGQAVFNNQTGQWEYPGQQRAQQQFVQGQVYTDAKGNRATWDGQKFVPVK